MRAKPDSVAVGIAIAAGVGLLVLAGKRARDVKGGSSSEELPAGISDYDRDVLSLSRMLASESGDPQIQTIIGWITLNAARTWRMTLYRLLTGKSGKFGHQKFFFADGTSEIRYASTAQRPTAETTRIARGLIDGTIRPPASIESTRPTAYVEMTRASRQLGPNGKPLQPETNAERILALQSRFGGIVGREGNWFFYAKGSQPIHTVTDIPLPRNTA